MTQCKVTLRAAQNGAKCESEEREWVVGRDGNFVSNVSCCHVCVLLSAGPGLQQDMTHRD